MTTGLKWFLGILLLVLLLVVCLLMYVRFHDGPVEIVAGGAFQSGELVTDVEDWSFLDEFVTLEMETRHTQRSRVLWLAVHDNRVYVYSNYMKSRMGRIWKRWPHQLMGHNKVIIRAGGKLYEMRCNRVREGEQIPAVLQRFNDKYQAGLTPEAVENESVWLFELIPG